LLQYSYGIDIKEKDSIKNMNTLHIPEPPEHYQRVSVVGVACIFIDGKYLLLRNKRSSVDGDVIHTAIGGALTFDRSRYDYLRDYYRARFHYDKEGYGTFDLRLFMEPAKIPQFLDWIKSTGDGERETSCFRELQEELVDEECLLGHADFINGIVDISPAGAYLVSSKVDATRGHKHPHLTHYVFLVDHVCFNETLEDKIRELVKTDERLVLKTQEEIESEEVHINHALTRFAAQKKVFREYARALLSSP